MDVDRVISRIVKTMTARDAEGKHFGVIVLAEGLAELLPMKYLKGIPRDEHGHISISHVNLGRMFAKLVSDEYKRQTGKSRKVTGLQLGYESRCARPQAFDVMLGSQLGVGAYRALVEEGLERRHGLGHRPAPASLRAVREADRPAKRWSPWSATSSPTAIFTAWRGFWKRMSTNKSQAGSVCRPLMMATELCLVLTPSFGRSAADSDTPSPVAA